MEKKSQNAGSKTTGVLFTLAGAAGWAVGGVFGQSVFMYNHTTAAWIVPVRLLLSGTIMLLLSSAGGNSITDIWKEKWSRIAIIIFGIFGSAVCQYGFYASIQYANAAVAAVLAYTSPVMILVYTVFREKRRPKPYEVLSVMLVLSGMFIYATHLQPGTLAVSPKALFWGLLSALCFSLYTLQPRRLLKKYNLFTVVGWGMTLGGLVLLPFCRFWSVPVTIDAGLFGRMAVVIIFGTIMSFCFYQQGVLRVGGIVGSILSSVEPVVSVLLSFLFLGVRFGYLDIIGFAMILSTVPIVAWRSGQ